ncbi:MAG: type II toxin-antitoxin system RelE/ParE family toxin [Bacteroidales bacterium]|jgi:mRNA interferase RelE/StbE|nr:type II toxin-antitoxin system RelE/ParE family toxin [Bacteroidales bacterium]
MIFHLETTPKFDKQLKKIDKVSQKQIVEYLSKNIEGTENPRTLGKALVGNRKGFWRYRVGDFRIICDIQDKECIVLALETASRKDIYR